MHFYKVINPHYEPLPRFMIKQNIRHEAKIINMTHKIKPHSTFCILYTYIAYVEYEVRIHFTVIS